MIHFAGFSESPDDDDDDGDDDDYDDDDDEKGECDCVIFPPSSL